MTDELTEKVARAMSMHELRRDDAWPGYSELAFIAIAAVREAEGPTLYTQADLDAAVRAAYEEGWYDGAKVPIGERGDQELGWACLMDYEKSAAAIRERGE